MTQKNSRGKGIPPYNGEVIRAMPRLHNPGDVVRFGLFEADLESAEVRKRGVRIRLQAQPFRVLAALLENPGSAVTREELRHRLWPDDTFVDFEHGLNAAVARLRQALGDSAEQPRYIETLSKRGYRFIGELRNSPAVVTPGPAPAAAQEPPPAAAHWLPKRRTAPEIVIAASVLLVAIAARVSYVASGHSPPAFHPVPLTSFKGLESSPSLSPNGESVAFSWDGQEGDNFDVYVLRIGSPVPVRLTTHSAPDLSPAWSPDGSSIAFLRRAGIEKGELVVVPACGGLERKIGEVRNVDLRDFPSGMRVSFLSWSPDARWIAASSREPGAPAEAIYLFSITGERRQLTNPPIQSHGDHMPAFSPDGRALAFCRLPGFNTSEINLLPLDAGLHAGGDVRPLTNHKRWSVNPAWSRDARAVLYIFSQVTNARSPRELRSIDTSRFIERTIPLDDNLDQMSLGRHLVYAQLRVDTNIWRARIHPPIRQPALPEPFLYSTRPDYGGRYSPDGKKISFASLRSGSTEIWVANSDGSNPIRLTSIGGSIMTPPAWSPDGQWLVFTAQPDAQQNLFVIAAGGGTPRRLTTSAFDESMPTYSRDGRWIYFNSMRSGRRQVWRIPATGGDAVQITTRGGLRPVESPDRKTIYYVAESGGAIWQVPVGGGKETEVVSCVHPTAYGFAVTPDGIYFRDCLDSGKQYIRRFGFDTRQSRPVVEATELPFGTSISVSPDGKYLLFDQAAKTDMDLMLVENFRLQ